MKVELKCGVNPFGGREALVFSVEESEQDRAVSSDRRPRLVGSSWFVEIMPEHCIDRMHPDLIALAALVSVGPFAKDEIILPIGISSGFAALVESGLKKRIGPVDPFLDRRVCPKSHRPALAFSGGVDSCAALKVLPDEVVPVFMRRRTPEGIKTLYRADAALASCDAVLAAGYDMHVLESSVEHMRDPVGFPVDWTNCLPIIVNADYFGASSVSFGMVMETAFHLGRSKYSELRLRSIYKSWAPLFEYVSLPISLPTSGLSEVLTSRIAVEDARQFLPQSCVRGEAGSPCMRCFKCFRKVMLEAVHNNRPVDPVHYQIPYESREVRKKLLEVPIHHEIVMAWTVRRFSEMHPVLDALKLKLSPVSEYGSELSFLERIYPRGLDYVPDNLKEGVWKAMLGYTTVASDADVAAIESWSDDALIADPRYEIGQERLVGLLS